MHTCLSSLFSSETTLKSNHKFLIESYQHLFTAFLRQESQFNYIPAKRSGQCHVYSTRSITVAIFVHDFAWFTQYLANIHQKVANHLHPRSSTCCGRGLWGGGGGWRIHMDAIIMVRTTKCMIKCNGGGRWCKCNYQLIVDKVII